MPAILERSAKVLRRKLANRKWTAQLQKYQLQWTAIYNKHGWANRSAAEKRELRHSILVDIFGDKNFNVSLATNREFDIIFLAQEFLLDNGILAWTKETAKTAIELGMRRKYVWNIEHAGYDLKEVCEFGAPEEYITAISVDKFRAANWRALNSKQLWQLFITIKNRVRNAAEIGNSLYPAAQKSAETDDNLPF